MLLDTGHTVSSNTATCGNGRHSDPGEGGIATEEQAWDWAFWPREDTLQALKKCAVSYHQTYHQVA